MARIPEAEIGRLNAEISLQRLIATAGIELWERGSDFTGRCPFHDDEASSLVVMPGLNRWRCEGSCQTGGSVLDWVMKMNGVSLRHAVELLRADPQLTARGSPVKQGTIRRLEPPVAAAADDQTLLDQVIAYYHETLKQSPEALAYLKSRGLDHPEALLHFKLGFANRTLGLRLPKKNREEGQAVRSRLQRLGVLRETGHEHFNGALVIPVFDPYSHVAWAYARKITPGLRAGTPLHLHLPGPPRGVWNLQALQASREIILCRGLIDALTFWCAGYRHVTATGGADVIPDDLLAAFRQYRTARVLIADAWSGTRKGAVTALAQVLTGAGIECWRIRFPRGMDANVYALQSPSATAALGNVIRKAAWLGKGAVVEPSGLPDAGGPQSEPHEIAEPGAALAPQSDPPIPPTTAPTDAAPPFPATPVPPEPAIDAAAQVRETEIAFTFADRSYRVRGMSRNHAYDALKVNVLVSRGEHYFIDTLDLYAARARAAYVTQAAVELRVAEDVIKTDLGRVLLKLESLQEQNIQRALAPQQPAAVQVGQAEQEAALAFLRAPDLVDRILADFEAIGMVGETTNKLVAYLAAVSRKLDTPLAVIVQSASAAGKSSLMDAVLALMPEEDRVKYSAMTGQSLFYMGETDLQHRILAIMEEEGASRVAYALKLLQSEGELTMASTGKDPVSGNLVTHEYRVEGPVMIFLATTAIDIDEELLNRCLVLTIDESRRQTQAIHALQRRQRTLDGLTARAQRDGVRARHANAQRLLRPLAVLNPYAGHLTFPDEATRTRRDHEKYLTLIDAVALLHQYQRRIGTVPRGERMIEYVEVTLGDIELANRLAHEVLGHTLEELPPQTRGVLMRLREYVAECAKAQAVECGAVRFTRRELREHLHLGDTQLRLHLARLVGFEYLLVHRGERGVSFVYELVYDGSGQDGRLFVPGLIDVASLGNIASMARSRGEDPRLAGPARPQRGAIAAGSRSDLNRVMPHESGDSADEPDQSGKTQDTGEAPDIPSYPQNSATDQAG